MKQRALTILEVVIATAILVVVGLIMVAVMTFGLRQMTRAKALHIASSLAQQKMEEAIEIAPNKLGNLNGNFTEQPDYSYQVTYTPTSQAPDFLQTVLVKVLGPFSTQAAYASALTSASGYSSISTSDNLCGLGGFSSTPGSILVVLDKSLKKVYIRGSFCKVALDFSGATSRTFTSVRLVHNGCGVDYNNNPEAYYTLYLIDQGSSTVKVCPFNLTYQGAYYLTGNIAYGFIATCGNTSADLSSLLTCSSFSNFFQP